MNKILVNDGLAVLSSFSDCAAGTNSCGGCERRRRKRSQTTHRCGRVGDVAANRPSEQPTPTHSLTPATKSMVLQVGKRTHISGYVEAEGAVEWPVSICSMRGRMMFQAAGLPERFSTDCAIHTAPSPSPFPQIRPPPEENIAEVQLRHSLQCIVYIHFHSLISSLLFLCII